MPSHNIHDNLTKVAAIVGTPLVAAAVNGVEGALVASVVAVAFGVGCMCNLVLTPDLDVNTGCISFHRMSKFNPLLGAAWQGYWAHYARMCKHRGLSHTPVIGTLGRVLYGLPWLFPIVIVAILYWPAALAWLLGLMWADLWHTGADVLDKMLGGRL